MASLWEMISAGSSANARKLANAKQPNYISAEEMNNSPTQQQMWANSRNQPVNSTPSLVTQNPLAVTEAPVVVPTNTGTVAGQGNPIVQKAPSLAMSQTPSQTTQFDTQPTVNGQQMPSSGQSMPPVDIGLNQDSNMYGIDFNNGLAKNSFGGIGDSEPNSLFGSLSKNLFDFSTPEATKNSLGNLATATNIGSSLFNAYYTYKTADAQADYQNRVASLYEKKYNDDKARLAKAQANYDASFKA